MHGKMRQNAYKISNLPPEYKSGPRPFGNEQYTGT